MKGKKLWEKSKLGHLSTKNKQNIKFSLNRAANLAQV